MPQATAGGGAAPQTREETAAVMRRVTKGGESALPAVRKVLRDPASVDNYGGDLAFQLEYSLVERAAGENLAFRDALLRKLELLRAELGGPGPSPLERLLVERAVTCWLPLHLDDLRLRREAHAFQAAGRDERLRAVTAGDSGERQDALPHRQGRGCQAGDRGPLRPRRAGHPGGDLRENRRGLGAGAGTEAGRVADGDRIQNDGHPAGPPGGRPGREGRAAVRPLEGPR